MANHQKWIRARWGYIEYLQRNTGKTIGCALAFRELAEDYENEFKRDLLKDLQEMNNEKVQDKSS